MQQATAEPTTVTQLKSVKLIRTIPAEKLAEFMQYAQGRMRKKLLGAQEALQDGVSQVCIGSTSLLNVLDGAGTTIEEISSRERINI